MSNRLLSSQDIATLVTGISAFMAWIVYKWVDDWRRKKAEKKRLIVDQAQNITGQMENINIVFYHGPVRRYIKRKVNTFIAVLKLACKYLI